MGAVYMKINELFNNKEVVFSFEIFPPKVTSPIETIYNTLEELKDLTPDYISVTYGAGGSLSENRTLELASKVKNIYGIESVAHLTCISSTKDEITHVLNNLKSAGVENILALRGDIPQGNFTRGDFRYASELVQFINNFGGFNVGAACYPECHPQCGNLAMDIKNLKTKIDAGVNNLVSQLFFDNETFYGFLEKAQKENIVVPIQAGIMPVVNKRQIERIISLCGASFPTKFMKIVDKYEHDSIALRDAGIAYAVEQIVDLVSSGVDGIHLYTMNNPYVAKKITTSISSILSSVNNKAV